MKTESWKSDKIELYMQLQKITVQAIEELQKKWNMFWIYNLHRDTDH